MSELIIAPSLPDFKIDNESELEVGNGFVTFNLISNLDDDFYVIAQMETSTDHDKHEIQNPSNCDPQDVVGFDYDYEVASGLAVVKDYHRVTIKKCQLIQLTPEQLGSLNAWLAESARESAEKQFLKSLSERNKRGSGVRWSDE
jgi:hypothetical protein